jgi:cytoskeletal protein CcmA (bactofilin family)
MAWWEKKGQPEAPKEPDRVWTPPVAPPIEKPRTEATPKVSNVMPMNQNPTVLGRSITLRGELTGNEDLLIEGQFDGTINLQEHCLTVGANGQVKAEIHVRQIVIHGTVNGNITAREKVDIRKTGRVQGDLSAAGVAIEDGAYFKGSIEIRREDQAESPRAFAASGAALTTKVERE